VRDRKVEILRVGERTAAGERAAELIIEELRLACAADRAPVTIACCGGSSPASIFPPFIEKFVALPESERSRVHFVLIDERRVPLEHAESNYTMLSRELFRPLLAMKAIEAGQIHPFPVELEPIEAARQYSRLVSETLGGVRIVILGVGPDGHVAAVFPDHPSIRAADAGYIYVSDRPKPPREGFSASRSLLEACEFGVLLFFGKEKAEALEKFFADSDVLSLPARVGRYMKRAVVITDLPN